MQRPVSSEPGPDPLAPESSQSPDARTAAAFATSWNTVGDGSVYTREQFLDWFSPIDPASLEGASVLELGFGNGSLLYHVGRYHPSRLSGVDLGDTLERTRTNLSGLPMVDLHRGDLTTIDLGQFDFVYCIGVLHHLDDPGTGFESVLRHTRPGGRFHCWVYAEEGNDLIIHVVDPIRRMACRLPWWVTKYAVALPLVVPYYAYAKILGRAAKAKGFEALTAKLPLAQYSLWIARRNFRFFHHVAFDQLVTPRTRYLSRSVIERWLEHPVVEPSSVYIVHRNANSWKFGGRRKPNDSAVRHVDGDSA